MKFHNRLHITQSQPKSLDIMNIPARNTIETLEHFFLGIFRNADAMVLYTNSKYPVLFTCEYLNLRSTTGIFDCIIYKLQTAFIICTSSTVKIKFLASNRHSKTPPASCTNK